MDVNDAGLVFTDPTGTPTNGAVSCRVRTPPLGESPVHRVEDDGFNPFWAITKHADAMEIERRHDFWLVAASAQLGAQVGRPSARSRRSVTT